MSGRPAPTSTTRPAPGGAGGRPAGIPGFLFVLLLVAVALAVAIDLRIRRPLTMPDARAPLAAWPDMRLDVNRAAAGELTALPGVGPRLAERIVEERAAGGPFRSLDDVERVHRVGPALVARMRGRAVAGTEDE